MVYQENDRTYDVQGTTANYFAIANWNIALGRFFTEAEVAESAPVCVIGETIRKELFGEGVDPIGSKIRVKTMTLEVIGVTAVKGQGGFGDDLDDNIITPYTTIIRRLSGRGNGQKYQPDHDLRRRGLPQREHRGRRRCADARAPQYHRQRGRTTSTSSTPSNSRK